MPAIRSIVNHPIVRLIALLGLMYVFFLSISLMGASFKFFGKNFAFQILETTSSPFVGLFIGILATSIVQSSSTTTSMTVGLVAGGALDIAHAIPIILGANIGTSVTNTLVSVGHISRPEEFRRAFAAATVHDFFNVIAVCVLFPLQIWTNFLGISAGFLARELAHVGGLQLLDPMKVVIKPAIHWIAHITHESGLWMLLISIALLFIALRYIVVTLKAIIIGRVQVFFSETLFRNSGRAFLVGLFLTVMVQSSSITTSLAVPLAGAGILTIVQIFPMTMGANVGTTITAILAALVTSDVSAVTVAFAHLLFNVFGIVLILPIRRVPIYLAETLASFSLRSKVLPIAYVLILFYLFPLILISLFR